MDDHSIRVRSVLVHSWRSVEQRAKLRPAKLNVISWTCPFLLPSSGKARGAVCLRWKPVSFSTVKRRNRLSRSDWTNIELFRIRESSSRIASSEIVSSLDSLATTLFPIAIRTKPSESKRTPPLDPVKIRSPPAKIGAVW